MTDEETLAAIAATETERLVRMTGLGDRGTAGPEPVPRFRDGWWSGARRVPAHPARKGGVIDACCVVDHTTDMHPDDWDALITAWLTRPGDGACAHFVIGRDERHGVVQLVPINRNGNHAGGPGHGFYVDAGGIRHHPNTMAIGIEFHCAGGMVRLVDGIWRFVEDGKIHGAPIDAAGIEADPDRPGRGWHLFSPYQEQIRTWLHEDLDAALSPLPAGLRAVSTGEVVPPWGVARSARFVGHVTLDPTHRSDPWPPGMRALLTVA